MAKKEKEVKVKEKKVKEVKVKEKKVKGSKGKDPVSFNDEFIRKTNQIIINVNDERVIEILSILKIEFKDLEITENEFVRSIDQSINTTLDKLAKDVKNEVAVEELALTLKDIKANLVKRSRLVNETI